MASRREHLHYPHSLLPRFGQGQLTRQQDIIDAQVKIAGVIERASSVRFFVKASVFISETATTKSRGHFRRDAASVSQRNNENGRV